MACSHVKEVIREEEESAAAKMLRRKYAADKVEDLEMFISHCIITATPFYVPAYVFRSHHYGRKLRTFVSGECLRDSVYSPPLELYVGQDRDGL